MRKWLIIIMIVGLIIMSDNVKKESKFSFRCDDDDERIEVYNKESGKYVVYEDCRPGTCEVRSDGGVECVLPESEPKQSNSSLYFLLITIGILLVVFRKKLFGRFIK